MKTDDVAVPFTEVSVAELQKIEGGHCGYYCRGNVVQPPRVVRPAACPAPRPACPYGRR